MSDNISPEDLAEILKVLNEEVANVAEGDESRRNSNSASTSNNYYQQFGIQQKRNRCDDNLSPEDLAAIEQALLDDDDMCISDYDSDVSYDKHNKKLCKNGNEFQRDPEEKAIDIFLDEMFEGRTSAIEREHRNWLELMIACIDEADGQIAQWEAEKITNFAREFRQRWSGNDDDKGNGNSSKSNEKLEKNSDEYRKRLLDPMLIAVVARANFLATGNKPRNAQLIALLELLSSKETGKLIQVSTGEGKTTIIAMHAAILTIAGGNKETVDIVTSNKILAIRDARDKKRRAFYSMLGLNVAHNIISRRMELAARQKPYKADIIYGDLGSFQGDMLDLLQGDNVRCDRPYANIIVDEVDSMLVDDITSGRILMLSHQVPGSELLHGFMEMAWKFWISLQALQSEIIYNSKENCYELRKIDSETGEQLVHRFKCRNMTDIVEKWMLDAIDSQDHQIRLTIPEHLKEFARSMTKKWANSMVTAFRMQEGNNYKITKDEHGFKCIKILDFKNTGTTLQQSRYSDGLHEFLEIKHQLKIRKGSIVTLFSSNLEYFKRYGTNIYGLTGTLGSEPAQQFLKRLYPVELVSIPTFKKKRLEELKGLLLANRKDWLNAIIDRVEKTVKEGRAILVISETVNQVETLRKELSQKLSKSEAKGIRIYSDDDSLEQKKEMEKCAEPGSIILSTNLAGRGTDIITSDRVDDKGGLFVLVTFLPLNMRVQMQNFGRTARQGRPGQCQMILCRRSENDQAVIYPSYWEFDNVIVERDMSEEEELDTFEKGKLPKWMLRDEIFAKFANFTEEMIKTMKDQDILRLQNEELWGIRLKEIIDELAGASEEKCINMADLLINELRQNLAQKKQAVKGDYLKNSVYMLKQAQHNLGLRKHRANDDSKVELEDTENLIQQATSREPIFKSFGYATHAMHDVIRSEQNFIVANNDSQESQRFRAAFIEHMQKAVEATNTEIDLLQGEQIVEGVASIGSTQNEASTSAASSSMGGNQLQTESNNIINGNIRSFDSERAAQIRRRVELLKEWQHDMMENIERARNCPAGQTIRIERYVNDDANEDDNEKRDENGDDEDEDGQNENERKRKQTEEEKRDMNSRGKPPKFIIGYQKVEPSFWSGIALIVLGVIQVGLGVVALCCYRPDLALALFENGLKDIQKGIAVAKGDDTINWNDYFREKAFEYSGTLIFSFGRFLMRKYPQMQRILELVLGQLSGTQKQFATVGLSQLFQRSMDNIVIQETVERNKLFTSNIEEMVKDLGQNINAKMETNFGPKSMMHAKLRGILAVKDTVEDIVGKSIETKRKSIDGFCANVMAGLSGTAVDMGAEFGNVLDGIYIEIRNNLNAFILKNLPTMEERFKEIFNNKAAWKNKEKQIAGILMRHGILLNDERIWVPDAAIKLGNLKLAEIELVREDIGKCIALFESDETKRKVESAKCQIKNMLMMTFKMALQKHAGQYRANAEDVKNLADAFKNFETTTAKI